MNQPLSPAEPAAATASAENPTRIMIVDDSAVIRGLIARIFDGQRDCKIVGVASDGKQAVNALQKEPADVIILDVEMPVMDGLTAIPHLKAVDSGAQIIMASTLTQKNADISLRALEIGATDYIPKPSSTSELASADDFKRELLEKVRILGKLARRRGVRRPPNLKSAPAPAPEPKKTYALRPAFALRPDIIAIGSSTGGPQALFEVIKGMGASLPQPILITQHMPPSFTAILADHLSRQCGVECKEGVDGEILKPGRYYIAPGDYHMLVARKAAGPTITIVKDPPENFCRPAVDPMLRSLIPIYGRKILAVILTGMGQDGCKGSVAVTEAGGTVIAQDEATSVVWGMPAAVANVGVCSAILPVNQIGSWVRQAAVRAA